MNDQTKTQMLSTLIATTKYREVKEAASAVQQMILDNPDADCRDAILDLLLLNCSRLSLSMSRIRERQRERRNEFDTALDLMLYGPNREPSQ